MDKGSPLTTPVEGEYWYVPMKVKGWIKRMPNAIQMAEPFICDTVSASVDLSTAQPPPLKGPGTFAARMFAGNIAVDLGLSIHFFSTFIHLLEGAAATAGEEASPSVTMLQVFSFAASAFSFAFGDCRALKRQHREPTRR